MNTGSRPQLPPSTPPSLRKFLEQCWDSDPKKRPTIDDIVNSGASASSGSPSEKSKTNQSSKWDTMLIEAAQIGTNEGREFWKSFGKVQRRKSHY